MSKFCQNCGKPMADDMRFCEACGAQYQAPAQQPQYQAPVQQPQYQAPVQQPQYQAPVQQPQYQQPVYQQPVAAPAAAPKKNFDVNKTVDDVKKTANGLVNRAKKDKKFLGICLGGVAAVLVVIILLIVLLSGKPYTGALKNEIKILTSGKGELIEKTAPKAYWEWYDDETDDGLDGRIDDFNDAYEDDWEVYEDYYGDNIKIKIDEISKDKKLSDSKLEDIADCLEDNYDIDSKSVKAARKVTAKLIVKGSDEEEKIKVEFYAVKIGGKWYLMTGDPDYYMGFGVYGSIARAAAEKIDD